MAASASHGTESWTTLVESIKGVIRTAQGAQISDEQAHRARKDLKKARASLRLLRRAIGKAAYHRENAVLRDASRVISPLRDARAQLDLVVTLGKRYRKEVGPADLAPVKNALRKELRRTRERVRPAAPTMRRMVAALRDVLGRLRQIAPRSVQGSEIRRALHRIYADARDGYARARSARTPRALHEWRKKTKYLYNAIDLLGEEVPKVPGRMCERAHKLGDYLGEEHDLVVLSGLLRRVDRPIRARTRRSLSPLITRRRKKLAKEALRLGAKTYADSPRKAVPS